MVNFEITQARNFHKIKSGGFLQAKTFSIIAKFGYFFICACVIAYFYERITREVSIITHLALFAGSISSLYLFYFYFIRSYYTPISYIQSDNLAEGLSQSMVPVILEAVKIAEQNKFAAIEPIVLLAAFEKSVDGKYMLLRAGFGLEKDISSLIQQAVMMIPRQQGSAPVQFPPQLLDVFLAAKENSLQNKRDSISSGDILLGLIQKSDAFKKIMFEEQINEEDIKRIVEWHELLKEYTDRNQKPFWEKDGVVGGIGRDWSFGYTQTLNQFGRNLNTEVEYQGEVHVYGRKREIDEIERILAKSGRHNVLLIGDPGIGKKTIVKGFVSKIIQNTVLPALKYQQVFQVDTGALLSGSTESGEIAIRIKKIFNEAVRAGNITLFFDNFHALVSKEKGVGQVNTAEIILPYLEGSVNVIGATTLKDYHKSIEANPGVAAAFDSVDVKEPNVQETVQILEELVPFIEHRNGVFWPYQSVREVAKITDRYIHNKPFPEKAIEIVDEVSVSIAKSGKQVVLAHEIDQLISKKLEVPIEQAEGEEAQKLLHLEEFLHKRVIGQEEAISAISGAMRRARSGIQSNQRPIGSFLFLGPTGVGKTETSKALAEAYFGSDKTMIRIDMSEFQEQSSIYRMIGSPPAAGSEGEKGQLTTAIADNPFSLVLLDEIEKAHKDILTLFLQVFDDGRLTDGTGKVIDFTNTIIIATSNAGSELIRENLLKNIKGEQMKKSLLDYLQQKAIFRPEFLNRFDAVVAFHPLSQIQIQQVAQLMLDSLSKRMAEKEITLQFDPKAVVKLAQVGFDPVYGARPMRRAIQDKVENALADAMLKGQLPRGSKVVLGEDDIK